MHLLPPARSSRSCLTAALLLLTALSGCDDFEFEGWLNQPIPIEYKSGIPVVQVSFRGEPKVTATIESGSPLTAIQSRSKALDLPGDGPLPDFDLLVNLGQSEGELRLQDGEAPDVTRFIFRNLPVVDVPLQPVGLQSSASSGQSPTSIGGLLGATLLSHFSVHLTAEPPRLMFRDALPDTDGDLAADCLPANLVLPGGFAAERCIGVFRTPRNGGGTVLLGDSELTLPASRLTVTLCVAPEAFDPTLARPTQPSTTGTPLSALISTGLGTSIISRSAFERLKARLPELEETPRQLLYLQTGALSVSTTKIPRIALVDDRALDLGPCGELARRRRLSVAPSLGILDADRDREGAAAAIAVSDVDFAIVADDAGILQGLRQELRSVVADVEVVLGGSFFQRFALDLDYPNGRTVLQCVESQTGASCRVYPACNRSDGPSCPDKAL